MRREGPPAAWVPVLTAPQEEVRRSVGEPGVTLVVADLGTGKTALARFVASDTRTGRTIFPAVGGQDLAELERQVHAQLGEGRLGDLVILDGLDELRPVPAAQRLTRFLQAAWIGQAHVLILARPDVEGVVQAFQAAKDAGSGSRSYKLVSLSALTSGVHYVPATQAEEDEQRADALLALLQSTAHNPRVIKAVLEAAQNQIYGDRAKTPDLLFVPDRDGQVRVVPSTDLDVADLELAPGRVVGATPRITYRATHEFWLPEAAELEALINDPATRERDLQAFFEEHPHLLAGSSYDRVIPHPILARDQEGPLIPDFMLEPIDRGFADVLDLKLPRARVVMGRKDRIRPSSYVNEALAQVREYRAYFEDAAHRQTIRDRYGLDAYRPTVAIIIGRDPGPGRDKFELKRIWDELPGHVRLMTYDDLLQQVRRLGRF